MARKRASAKREEKPKVRLESQDDQAYITGQHSQEEQEKQIRTPMPRRRGGSARGWSESGKEEGQREEGDGSGQKED